MRSHFQIVLFAVLTVALSLAAMEARAEDKDGRDNKDVHGGSVANLLRTGVAVTRGLVERLAHAGSAFRFSVRSGDPEAEWLAASGLPPMRFNSSEGGPIRVLIGESRVEWALRPRLRMQMELQRETAIPSRIDVGVHWALNYRF
jgi:hypothetical protein